MPVISHALTANSAVRKFLKDVTNDYGVVFDPNLKQGKVLWNKVKKGFGNRCAYCQKKKELQKEHLVGANRQECGLDHIGNIVPCCASCNARKTIDGVIVDWKKQLEELCAEKKVNDTERVRREKRILSHIKKYKYPAIPASQKKLIRVIAENLYVLTAKQGEDLKNLYDDLKEIPKPKKKNQKTA